MCVFTGAGRLEEKEAAPFGANALIYREKEATRAATTATQ